MSSEPEHVGSSGETSPRDLDGLMSEVYTELHRLAQGYFRRQPPGHTLQTTALVHEAYLKLSAHGGAGGLDRAHFYCLAAKAMRQILVNHARDRSRLKRGGGRRRVSLDEAVVDPRERPAELEALDEALEKLAGVDRRKSEVVELRYFGGLSIEETAAALDVSPATVTRDWTLARAWLLQEMSEGGEDISRST